MTASGRPRPKTTGILPSSAISAEKHTKRLHHAASCMDAGDRQGRRRPYGGSERVPAAEFLRLRSRHSLARLFSIELRTASPLRPVRCDIRRVPAREAVSVESGLSTVSACSGDGPLGPPNQVEWENRSPRRARPPGYRTSDRATSMANDTDPLHNKGPLQRALGSCREFLRYDDHRASLVSVFLFVLAAVALGFGLANVLYFELYLLGGVELVFFAVIAAALVDLRCNGAVDRVAWLAVVSFGGLSLLFYVLIKGAYDGSVWLLWFPFVAFFLLGTRWGLYAFAVYSVIVVSLILSQFGQWPSIGDSETLTNIFGALAALGWMTFYQERITERAYRRISELANTDVLTGIANRRSFMAQFDRTGTELAANGQPCALVLIDIDHFKEINDTHGHTVGDRVIQEVSQRIAAVVRRGDVVGRLGGEEFGVLLTDCDETEAARRADEIRNRIAREPIATGLEVTVSVGVVSRESAIADFEVFFTAADDRLYEAKAQGRNRTVAHTVAATDTTGG